MARWNSVWKFSAVVVVASICFQLSAHAENQQVIAATTYLRPGPGNFYMPIDEVLTGTAVAVIGCGKGWCRISYDHGAGYVPQASLKSGASAELKNPACFVHGQAGYHGSREMAICHTGVLP